jgi:hypothetical protein
MVRLPRILGKKRGHRRTGSQIWGSFGEGVFHAVVFCAGLAFAGLLISGIAVPEWRINHDYVETRCQIVGTGLARRMVEDPPGSFTTFWRPTVRVRYVTDRGFREVWAATSRTLTVADRAAAMERLAAWRLGSEVPGWYDPADPDVVVLERGYNWWMWLLALLLPGALLAFGGTGLGRAIRRWGRSEEAIAARAGGIKSLAGSPPAVAVGHPAVPGCDDLVNSPGTVLRYRLPIESPENWTLLGLGLFAVLWNAVVVVLAINAGLDLAGGRIDRLLVVLLVPFLVIGIAGITLFVRGLFLAAAVGPTQLEISDHPLRPGQRYEVLLAQGGAGVLKELELALELEEQATFRQGTDTRSERLVVWRQVVATRRDVQLDPVSQFELQTLVQVPTDAMHSFMSEHNAVRWWLTVRGTPARWQPFVRLFPVIVYPPSGVGLREGHAEPLVEARR